MVSGGHPAEDRGTSEDADQNEGNDRGLAKPKRERPQQRRCQQEGATSAKAVSITLLSQLYSVTGVTKRSGFTVSTEQSTCCSTFSAVLPMKNP